MNRPGRVVLMPGNNALIDARVMKNLRTVADLGYEAIALGISRGEAVHQEWFDWGGRVIVQPVNLRLEAWRRYRRSRVFMDRTDRAIGTSYVKYLNTEINVDTERAARDAYRGPSVANPPRPGPLARHRRLLHWALLRVVVKARSFKADREIQRDSWDPARLESWRIRQFAWLRLMPWRTAWRRTVPKAVDEAMDLLPQLEALDPDIIHVHDAYMMATAARYAHKAAAKGRKVGLVYDAREFVRGLAHVPPQRVLAYAAMEHEFIADFDRVVTVSESLATLLVDRFGLLRRPDIVMNAPLVAPRDPITPSVRQMVGLDADTPLMIYGGVVNPARGVQTAVRALPLLEGVHLALIVNNRGHAVTHLEVLATELGVAERLHLCSYVPQDQVTHYIADATLGLSPLSHAANHDVALTNKFCEYIAAGLPVVTSDTPEQANLVADLDLGEVFRADDADDLARAVRAVLERRDKLAKRVGSDRALRARFSWPAQAQVLERVYAELLRDLDLAGVANLPGASE